MSELLQKLGIDWKLLLAQAVNFLIILVVLRLTVYKPLIKMLHERKNRIEQGLKDASDAKTRLGEVEVVAKEKIAGAEKESLQILAKVEKTAKEKEDQLMRAAKAKEEEMMLSAEKSAKAKQLEAEKKVYEEATGLVRAAIAKTVELSPDAIDEALVREAVKSLKKA